MKRYPITTWLVATALGSLLMIGPCNYGLDYLVAKTSITDPGPTWPWPLDWPMHADDPDWPRL